MPEVQSKQSQVNIPDFQNDFKKFKVFIVSHEVTMANDFEKKLLACYNLFIDLESEDSQAIPKSKSLLCLTVYKERLRNYVTRKKFTPLQIQQLACTWMMTLAKYLNYFQAIVAEYAKTKRKNKKNTNQNAITGCKNCISLITCAKDNNFLSLTDYKILGKLFDSVVYESFLTEHNTRPPNTRNRIKGVSNRRHNSGPKKTVCLYRIYYNL